MHNGTHSECFPQRPQLPEISPWPSQYPGLPTWPQLPPWAQPVYTPWRPGPSEIWC